jgi:hypothetical protein
VRLSKVVVMVLLAACTDSSSSSDCVSHMEMTFDIHTPADPPLQLRVESCRLDIDACPDLCAMEMVRDNVNGQQSGCDVSFQGDTVHVKISYDEFDATQGCAQPVEVGSGAGSSTTVPKP